MTYAHQGCIYLTFLSIKYKKVKYSKTVMLCIIIRTFYFNILNIFWFCSCKTIIIMLINKLV